MQMISVCAVLVAGMFLAENCFAAASDFAPKEFDNIASSGDLVANTVPSVIRYVIGVIGAVAFASFMYSGVMMVIYGENEDDVAKYKTNMLWSVVGLAVAGLAFIIVTHVIQFVTPVTSS